MDSLTVPTVPQAHADALIQAAVSLDDAPYTKQEISESERRIREAKPVKRSGTADVSVIDTFNANHDIETMLLSYGYTRRGKYLVRPGGKGSSVWITENKSYHFSSNDTLNIRHKVDCFEVFRRLEHGGDLKKAVKAAAELLGIKRSGSRGNGTGNGGNGSDPEGKEAESGEDRYHLTDTGTVWRLINNNPGMFLYNKLLNIWFIWNGKYWQKDETNNIYHFVDQIPPEIYLEASDVSDKDNKKKLKSYSRTLENIKTQIGVINKAATFQKLNITTDKLDNQDDLFNCSNCTLDLSDGEVKSHPHRREDFLTRAVNVKYDAKEKCPRWEQFLGEIFAGDAEIVQFMQRAVGYNLTGDVSENCLFFAYGTGKNGKSIFFNTLEILFGDYFYKAPADMVLQQKQNNIPSDVAQLKGKRCVVTSELDENRRLNEAGVKNLTGGDAIVARPMYKEWFTFRPTHKLWIFGNHKPVISGTDEGIWRRVQIIPFTVYISEEMRRPSRELLDGFKNELSGILNWALAGYLRYRENGFNKPRKMIEAHQQYRSDSDSLGQFIDEYCIINPQANILVKSLWKAYFGWSQETGERAISARRLCQLLQEREIQTKRGTGNKKIVLGLTLTEAASYRSYQTPDFLENT